MVVMCACVPVRGDLWLSIASDVLRSNRRYVLVASGQRFATELLPQHFYWPIVSVVNDPTKPH